MTIHNYAVLKASDLNVVKSQFGIRFVEGGAPNGLFELYTEDDENWHFVTTANCLWLCDLHHLLIDARRQWLEKMGKPLPALLKRRGQFDDAES